MHGAHAQVMSAAELSVAIRLPGSTRQSVRDALTDGSLTKTFGPRGRCTWCRPATCRCGRAPWARAPRRQPVPARRAAHDAQTAEVVAAVGDALLERAHGRRARRRGGRAHRLLGRRPGDARLPGVLAALAASDRPAAHSRRARLRGRPRSQGHLHQPAPFATPPSSRHRPRSPSPGSSRRYLHAFGPATAAAPGAVERRARAVGAVAARRRLPRRRSTSTTGVPSSTPGTPSRSRWAGVCGCFPTSTRWRGLRAAGGHVPRPGAPSGRWRAPRQATTRCSWSTGSSQGVWHQRRSGRRIHVTVETWADLGPTRLRALDAQVARLGEILEGEPRLTLGEVTVGPHA